MRLNFLFPIIFLAACSSQQLTCTSTVITKKDLIGNLEQSTQCDCKCPKPNASDLLTPLNGIIAVAANGN